MLALFLAWPTGLGRLFHFSPRVSQGNGAVEDQAIGLGIGMAVSQNLRDYGGAASAGMQLMNLSYSRGDESQSDELGLRYISRLQYDPDAMIGVFQMLGQVGGGAEGKVPEWQLTHPLSETREADMRKLIADSGVPRTGTVNSDVFLDLE